MTTFARSVRVTPLLLTTVALACAPPQEDISPQDDEATQVAALADDEIDLEKIFVIRDPSVVEDPIRTVCNGPSPEDCGPWTFGAIMASLAGTHDHDAVSALTLDLLSKWETNQHVNSFTVPARPAIAPLVTQPWLQASGPSGRLDFSKAPMRLLAIVSRMDLRAPDLSHAGEGRFVFGVLDEQGFPTSFTVIFEYRLIAPSGCEDVKLWAWAWLQLLFKEFNDPEAGTDDYNAWLQVLTDHFAGVGNDPSRPNGSSINQVRTNEIAIGSPWELRELRLACSDATDANLPCRDALFEQVTVKQTPDISFQGSPALAAFINQNEAAILAGTHVVPDTFQGVPFLGGAAPVQGIWDAPGIQNPLARDAFALNTCDGCHQAETGTGFLHVGPRTEGFPAPLSPWLTEVELPRREEDFRKMAFKLIDPGCSDVDGLAPEGPIPTH